MSKKKLILIRDWIGWAFVASWIVKILWKVGWMANLGYLRLGTSARQFNETWQGQVNLWLYVPIMTLIVAYVIVYVVVKRRLKSEATHSTTRG